MSEENCSNYSESSSSDKVDTFDDLGVDEKSDEEGNVLGLSPFMFEPERSEEEAQVLMVKLNTETHIEEQQESRTGHTNWCSCEKCKAMLTDEESLCCRDTNDIPDNHFQGLHKPSNMFIHGYNISIVVLIESSSLKRLLYKIRSSVYIQLFACCFFCIKRR